MELLYTVTLASPLNSLLAAVGIEVPTSLVFGVIVALVVILALQFKNSASSEGTVPTKRGSTALIYGGTGAGKTVLFGQLSREKFLPTLTSQTANIAKVSVSGADNEIQVVDYPGHYRLRQGLDKYVARAGCVVFVVNANGDEASYRAAADYLYSLFTNHVVNDLQIPILIALNKSELLTAKSQHSVRTILEKELNELRSSQAATPGQQDSDDDIFLGILGQRFSIDQLPFEVSFAEISGKEGNVEPVLSFLRESSQGFGQSI
eukprot:TRINITY_DN10404_c0_g1_i1.p1 TRINITY_DN10404_c0_g1~~TRINITY_DN10404_c0_g1_i1.p1  ORF type:complete len:270 (-),score=57.40 TRINITY_DN10404_c0_g1_i1:61-849(-)